jgi:hypothetical protein
MKLERMCAGNRRVCTSVIESCCLSGRRVGCTVWRDIRPWHFRIGVCGVDTGVSILECRYWTLPRHTALRVRKAHGLFPHSDRLATWHFCLWLEFDHGGLYSVTTTCGKADSVTSMLERLPDQRIRTRCRRSVTPRLLHLGKTPGLDQTC